MIYYTILLIVIKVILYYTSAPNASFHLLADDTRLFYSNKNLKTLETNVNVALNNISNWLKVSKLTLNFKKSHLLIFNINKSNDNNKMQIKLFIDKEEVEQRDTAKYLGIYFGNSLTWNKHFEYINCELSKGSGLFRKICARKNLKKYI